eukprot:CAMPEP_0171222156 /NCGR_PEP_ID=MMETSP0790-20130122/35119_1 /TAXON_ID=2925 /ORGANISM="Alexandrium catenella, Strain OF101" /LENGTH=52 /DNA_ID=CAMNT_0011688095 /DNA_START=57 /DNA_END=212 /DNA_ORIENTATION=+
MQLRGALAAVLVLAVAGHRSAKRSKLDINQKVYIENAPVLGDTAGEGILNIC